MSPLPRSVVLDLVPLYLAGEVSEETRVLIDDYLATDAKLSAYVRAHEADPGPGQPAGVSLDALELRTVSRTRAVLARQRWLFGLALGFTAVGLSTRITIVNGRPTGAHLVLLDSPVAFGLCLGIAALCWIGYAKSRNRL